MIESNYVSYRKTRIPRRWSSTSRDPGQGCEIHSGPKVWHPECQARFSSGTGRAVFDRIFGMPQPGYQWRRSESCIMEFRLIPSGPGAQAPGKIKKAPRAQSYKLQAPSCKRLKKDTIK